MLMKKVGLKTKGADATAGDKFLQEEREMYTRDGQKEPGFASAVVPTLEEKVIAEHRPPQEHATASTIHRELEVESGLEDEQEGDVGRSNGVVPNGDAGKKQNGSATAPNGHGHSPEPPQAHLETGELYGAPADASVDPMHDDQPPHARAEKTDADEEESKAPAARATLRKHLAAKLGNKTWQLPTPTPHVDPYGFEDPICDAFWKETWVASAVHNVGHLVLTRRLSRANGNSIDRDISQSLPCHP